jgi:signal transduction histidine kinase
MTLRFRFALLVGLLLGGFLLAFLIVRHRELAALGGPLASDGSSPAADWRQVKIWVGFGALLVLGLALALDRWVLLPLQKVSHALATGNLAEAERLAAHPSEVNQLAVLVVDSFRQRQALEREIEERTRAQATLEKTEGILRQNIEDRARLGRNLHDGVIQSLYAAGMGLASIRPMLGAGQTEVSTRLEQTRATLNETIHDVRNFILGLEPEGLKQKTFAQAVTAMLESMRNLRPFTSTVEINEALAARLTLAQRVHALQITREAVSNALRHGEANHLEIVLRRQGESAVFQIGDDGRGFDPTTLASPGKGLANFTQRARELGAELTIDSQPAKGTCVKLVFSVLIV